MFSKALHRWLLRIILICSHYNCTALTYKRSYPVCGSTSKRWCGSCTLYNNCAITHVTAGVWTHVPVEQPCWTGTRNSSVCQIPLSKSEYLTSERLPHSWTQMLWGRMELNAKFLWRNKKNLSPMLYIPLSRSAKLVRCWSNVQVTEPRCRIAVSLEVMCSARLWRRTPFCGIRLSWNLDWPEK